MSAFPPMHYGGILTLPTETIYALIACVGLQRSGITSSSCSDVGIIAGPRDSGNGQKGGNNLSVIDRRKYFSSSHDLFLAF